MKNSQGTYFDLKSLFDDLNQRFFARAIKAELYWGRKRSALAHKRSIRLGSYNPGRQSITIHPCLDQAIVPAICVERILFHEMAHQKFPGRKTPSGKVVVHYQEFYDFEKNYPFLLEADLWIKANLQRLLRY